MNGKNVILANECKAALQPNKIPVFHLSLHFVCMYRSFIVAPFITFLMSLPCLSTFCLFVFLTVNSAQEPAVTSTQEPVDVTTTEEHKETWTTQPIDQCNAAERCENDCQPSSTCSVENMICESTKCSVKGSNGVVQVTEADPAANSHITVNMKGNRVGEEPHFIVTHCNSTNLNFTFVSQADEERQFTVNSTKCDITGKWINPTGNDEVRYF